MDEDIFQVDLESLPISEAFARLAEAVYARTGEQIQCVNVSWLDVSTISQRGAQVSKVHVDMELLR